MTTPHTPQEVRTVTTRATYFDLYWTFPMFYNVARYMTIVRVWLDWSYLLLFIAIAAQRQAYTAIAQLKILLQRVLFIAPPVEITHTACIYTFRAAADAGFL